MPIITCEKCGLFSSCCPPFSLLISTCSHTVYFSVFPFFSYVPFLNIRLVDAVVVVVVIIFIVTVQRVTNFDKKTTVTAPTTSSQQQRDAQVCRHKHTTQPPTTYRGCALFSFVYTCGGGSAAYILLRVQVSSLENCSTYYTQNIQTIHILFAHMFMFVAVLFPFDSSSSTSSSCTFTFSSISRFFARSLYSHLSIPIFFWMASFLVLEIGTV